MNRKDRGTTAQPGNATRLPPKEAEKLLRQAVALHQAGRVREAGPLYDRILSAYPTQPDALHLSGILHTQAGRPAEGLKRIQRAIDIVPDRAEFHGNLGQALANLGKAEAAENALRRALEIQPNLHDAHNNLGNILKSRGDIAGAESAFRSAIRAQPAFAGAWNNLGNLLGDAGRAPEALEALRRAANLAPNLATVHVNLGAVLLGTGESTAAEQSLKRALEIAPSLNEAHIHLGMLYAKTARYIEAIRHFETAIKTDSKNTNLRLNLASALRGAGKLAEAEEQARRVLKNDPASTEALRVLGTVLRDQRQLDAAHETLSQALANDPEDPATLNENAQTLQALGRICEATACYQKALERRPGFPAALNNLGMSLLSEGQIESAEEALSKALELDRDNSTTASNLLLASNYRGRPRKDVYDLHRAWAGTGRKDGASNFAEHDRTPTRQIRIGFVSADFRRHSVAYFIRPLLENVDHERLHITCYANVRRPDETTEQLRKFADSWVDIVGLSDTALVSRIRADAIDILIDLSGHTRGNRLGVFAQRAAPVQMTWLGYPNTTALDAMDYRITDVIADPPGSSEKFYTETLVHLPDGFLCYQAPTHTPDVTPLPERTERPVTFASFNNWSKISRETIASWARILDAVPDSRLFLKSRALTDETLQRRCLSAFAANGITEERLTFAGWHPDPAAHLDAYSLCDVALDTSPYNGTTTTCEALWMGVPVVTLRGDRHASRVGASLLHQIGLDDLVANSVDEFVQIASTLAQDGARLADLRHTLRQRVRNSPLGDELGFAHRFAEVLSRTWMNWCVTARR